VTAAVVARRRAPRFSEVFDPRANALNAVRLVLAVSVLVWHSYPLTGHQVGSWPVEQLLGHVGVDGFFAISGYLITSSWLRSPHAFAFLRARLLRILPGFWVSLLVTALAVGPSALLVRGLAVGAGYWHGALAYVVGNAGLWITRYDLAGTPVGVPYPYVWNGSLWTLAWEFLCYLAVLVLGLVHLLRHRSTVVVAFVLMLVAVLATTYGPVDNRWVTDGARFGMPFVAGALVHHFADRIPVRPVLLGVAGLLVVGSAWLPDYRAVAALPLAYLVLCVGAVGRSPRLRLRDDLSYGTYIYAFPVQQLLATAGLARAGVAAFALVALVMTLPLAALSWFSVERPALRLKGVRRPRDVQEAGVSA